MNKKTLIAVLIILFIPAVIALVLVFRMSSDKLDGSTVYEVCLTNPYGESLLYDTDEDIEAFTSVINSGTEVGAPVQSIDSYKKFDISFRQLSGEKKYTLYLTSSPDDCLFYYEDKWYRISSEEASKILMRDDMVAAYPYEIPPCAAFIIDGVEYPRDYNFANWFYTKADGSLSNFVKDKVAAEETDIYSIKVDSEIGMAFALEPDWCDVKLYIGDTLVFDNYLSELHTFDYGRDAYIKAVFTAEWYQKDSTSYYGKTIYEFYLDYDAEAMWDVSASTVSPGELVYIRLYNIADEDFKVETDLITSEFHNIVDVSNANILLFPVSVYNKAGDYTISVISDKTRFDIPLKVSQKSFESANISYGGDNYFAAQSAFFDFMKKYDSTFENEQLWTTAFKAPVDKYDAQGKELYWVSTPRYGESVYVNGELSEYKNYGIHYVCSEQADVKACAGGKVIFVGETEFLGNTVIIEHGFGLKSIYGFLDEVFVFADSSVEQGWRIGRTGSGGTARLPGLYLAFSVNGVYLNPFAFIDENVDFINISPAK